MVSSRNRRSVRSLSLSMCSIVREVLGRPVSGLIGLLLRRNKGGVLDRSQEVSAGEAKSTSQTADICIQQSGTRTRANSCKLAAQAKSTGRTADLIYVNNVVCGKLAAFKSNIQTADICTVYNTSGGRLSRLQKLNTYNNCQRRKLCDSSLQIRSLITFQRINFFASVTWASLMNIILLLLLGHLRRKYPLFKRLNFYGISQNCQDETRYCNILVFSSKQQPQGRPLYIYQFLLKQIICNVSC